MAPIRANRKGENSLFSDAYDWLAETEGFEPSVRNSPYDGLANRWFQPLTHVSEAAAKRGYSGRLSGDQPGMKRVFPKWV